MCLSAGSAFAGGRTVRVGFRPDAGYCEFDELGRRVGYNVEWVKRVATMLDWRVEWVDVGWGGAAEALREKRVDVVPGFVNLPEVREAVELGRAPIGFWRMVVYVLAGSPIDAADGRILDGLVIGVPRGHPMNARLKRFMGEFGARCVLKDYDSRPALERALFNGDVGAVFSEPSETLKYEKTLFSIPSEPMYFAVPKGGTELIDAIDEKVQRVTDDDREFVNFIRARYLRRAQKKTAVFTLRERAWLDRQRRDSATFAVDLAPIDGYFKRLDDRTGNVVGNAVKLLDEISDLSGLVFVADGNRDGAKTPGRLLSGEVQLAMPYGEREAGRFAEIDSSHELRVPVLQAVCTRRYQAVNVHEPQVRLAVSGTDGARIKAYRALGIDRRTLVCADERAALAAVLEGRADCMVGDYTLVRRLVELEGGADDFEIRIVHDLDYSPTFPIYVSPRAEPQLLSVLSKVVGSITAERLAALADRASVEEFGRRGTTFREVMKITVPFAAAVLAAVAAFFYYSRRRMALVVHKLEMAVDLAQNSVADSAKARKDLKEELERAEYIAQSKMNFLATMSHEIRTPLNAVIGYAEFLADPAVSPEKLREYSNGITLAANALLALINDVLDISKFESGRREGLDLRSGECDPKALFAEMRSVFRLRCRDKGIGIEFAIADDVPPLVLNEGRLRQILMNLLGNAVKFTDRGGITVSADYAEGRFTLRVRDTGIGISERGQKYIFDPFAQDMESRQGRVYAGTGLGLSIVKRLVESSDGTVTVASEVGRGSEFTVTVPDVKMAVRRQEEPAAPEAEAGPRAVCSVVIVDDMMLNRQILQLHCQSLGVKEIKVFASGQEVVDHLTAGGRPDVILSDMWMPGMDGSQLAAAVVAKWPEIPIVAVTADTDPGNKFDVSAFSAILAKPVTGAKLKELFAKIEEGGLVRS